MMNNGVYFIIFSGLEISLRYSFIVYSFSLDFYIILLALIEVALAMHVLKIR